MPTKSQSLEFVRANKKELGIKVSGLSVSQLNSAIDRAVEKKDVSKDTANKWKRMKLISDKTPQEMEAFMKTLKKKQLKEGTLGKSAPVPKLARDKKKNYN